MGAKAIMLANPYTYKFFKGLTHSALRNPQNMLIGRERKTKVGVLRVPLLGPAIWLILWKPQEKVEDIFLTTLELILKCVFDPWSDLKLCTPSWQTLLSLQFVDLWCNVGRLSTSCLFSPLQHQDCHCLTDLTLTGLTRVTRMTKVTKVTIVTRLTTLTRLTSWNYDLLKLTSDSNF